MKRLKTFNNLKPSYLFPEIEKRKAAYLKKYPHADIISLGIGDTVLPLDLDISKALEKASRDLGTKEGYTGYGKDQGLISLREAISEIVYEKNIKADEIFVSDGAKCDIARLQFLFKCAESVGLQDPAYPVYLEGSILQDIKNIQFLPCTPRNAFFPKFPQNLDLLYICNPNNPTGTAYTRDQLKKIVDYAKENSTIVLYDGAYSSFIQDPLYPKSIYEIEGGREVAIEVHSFSKMVGFSGIRLGWTTVPKELKFDCGQPVWDDWLRLTSTIFNGASNIAQSGGLSVFSNKNWKSSIFYYMENAKILKKAFQDRGYVVYGGENAPYLWVHTPNRLSWEIFQFFLEQKHILVTPGVGYGPSGEHFFRVSSFAHRKQINKIIERIN